MELNRKPGPAGIVIPDLNACTASACTGGLYGAKKEDILSAILDAQAKIKALEPIPPLPVRVLENPLLVVDGDPVEVPRTWRERLFSRPWRPFKATKTVIPKVPMPSVYLTGDGTVYAHPEIAAQIRKGIPARITDPLFPRA